MYLCTDFAICMYIRMPATDALDKYTTSYVLVIIAWLCSIETKNLGLF